MLKSVVESVLNFYKSFFENCKRIAVKEVSSSSICTMSDESHIKALQHDLKKLAADGKKMRDCAEKMRQAADDITRDVQIMLDTLEWIGGTQNDVRKMAIAANRKR
jgi:hypothetical protein